jgi:hypothetical protein
MSFFLQDINLTLIYLIDHKILSGSGSGSGFSKSLYANCLKVHNPYYFVEKKSVLSRSVFLVKKKYWWAS